MAAITFTLIIFFNIINLVSGSYKCDDTILLSSQISNEIYDNKNHFVKDLFYINHEIKLTNNKPVTCFHNANKSIEIALKYVSHEETCEQMSTLYYIPKNPEVRCDLLEKSNTGNQEFPSCQDNSNDIIHSRFYNIIADKKVIQSGCNNEYRAWTSNKALWWVMTLHNFGHDVYKVQKCFKSYIISTVELYITRNKNYENMKIHVLRINDYNPYIHTEHDFKLFINKITMANSKNQFHDKCFITDESTSNVAVVDSCNDENSLIGGLLGEIKCPNKGTAQMTTNHCQVAAGITSIKFDDYNNKDCKLNSLDYAEIMVKNKLPKFNSQYYITYRAVMDYGEITKIFSMTDLNRADILNMKTDLGLTPIVTKSKCDILIPNDIINIEQILNENEYAKFKLNIYSDINSTILFQCQNQNVIIPSVIHIGKSEFSSTTISFLPYLSEINTKCDIFCDNELELQIDLNAKFKILHNSSNAIEILKNNNHPSLNNGNDSDNGLWNDITQFFSNAKNYIISKWEAFLSTISSIIGLIFICFIIYILQKCGFNICLCCKQKKKKNDEEHNLEMIALTSLLSPKVSTINETDDDKIISNNNQSIYYTYNNQIIKIYKNDYTLNNNGVYYKDPITSKSKKIIDSIPKLIFFKNNFTYNLKDDQIIDTETNIIIIEKYTHENFIIHPNYNIKKNIIYHKTINPTIPLIMLRKYKNKNIIILNNDYYNNTNSLYRKEEQLIIKNFFIDF